MGEVQGLSLRQLRLDGGPGLGLGGIREKVHDYCSLADGLVQLEEVLSWHPSVFDGLVPGGTIFSYSCDVNMLVLVVVFFAKIGCCIFQKVVATCSLWLFLLDFFFFLTETVSEDASGALTGHATKIALKDQIYCGIFHQSPLI